MQYETCEFGNLTGAATTTSALAFTAVLHRLWLS